MSAQDIARAERIAGTRAILFYLMATLLIGSEIVALEDVEQPWRLAVWLALAGFFALNLTPLAARLRPRTLGRLLDDETTREHRRTSLATGFWVALAAAAIVAVVTSFEPLAGPVVARIIVTAALSAALISFGIQERQAIG